VVKSAPIKEAPKVVKEVPKVKESIKVKEAPKVTLIVAAAAPLKKRDEKGKRKEVAKSGIKDVKKTAPASSLKSKAKEEPKKTSKPVEKALPASS